MCVYRFVCVSLCVFIIVGTRSEDFHLGTSHSKLLMSGLRFDFKFRVKIRLRSDLRVSTGVRQPAVMV